MLDHDEPAPPLGDGGNQRTGRVGDHEVDEPSRSAESALAHFRRVVPDATAEEAAAIVGRCGLHVGMDDGEDDDGD